MSLRELLGIDRLTQIVDVGDYPIDGDPPYKPMLDAGLAEVVGLDAHNGGFIGDGGEAELNFCKAPGFTSLLRPDPQALEVFRVFQDNAKILRQEKVKTRRLDDCDEIGLIDFLKSDCQGSEYDVVCHGLNKLAATAVIQLEISFVCLYKNQRPFGQIDNLMRSRGFIPHTFETIKSFPQNQLLEADIVYVPDFIHPDNIADDTLRQMALILHYCYGNHAIVCHLIGLLEKRGLIYDATRRYKQMVAQLTAKAA